MSSVPDAISPSDSVMKALFYSTAIGGIAFGTVEKLNYALGGWFLGDAAAIAAGFYIAAQVWKFGWRTPAGPGTVAVHTVFNKLARGIYAGDVWGVPGVEDFPIIDMRQSKVDPAPFKQLAADRNECTVDGYFLRKVSDPYRTYEASDSDGILLKSFISCTESFVNQSKKAVYLTGMAKLITNYLKLPSGTGNQEYAEFKATLLALTKDSPEHEACFTEEGAKKILSTAGKFVSDAARLGLSITDVSIENIDIDQRISDAAAAVEAEKARMAVFVIQNDKRLEMAKAFMDADKQGRMSFRDATNLVDRAMGLGVTTNINELDFRDANLIAHLFAGVSESIVNAIKDSQKKP